MKFRFFLSLILISSVPVAAFDKNVCNSYEGWHQQFCSAYWAIDANELCEPLEDHAKMMCYGARISADERVANCDDVTSDENFLLMCEAYRDGSVKKSEIEAIDVHNQKERTIQILAHLFNFRPLKQELTKSYTQAQLDKLDLRIIEIMDRRKLAPAPPVIHKFRATLAEPKDIEAVHFVDNCLHNSNKGTVPKMLLARNLMTVSFVSPEGLLGILQSGSIKPGEEVGLADSEYPQMVRNVYFGLYSTLLFKDQIQADKKHLPDRMYIELHSSYFEQKNLRYHVTNRLAWGWYYMASGIPESSYRMNLVLDDIVSAQNKQIEWVGNEVVIRGSVPFGYISKVWLPEGYDLKAFKGKKFECLANQTLLDSGLVEFF